MNSGVIHWRVSRYQKYVVRTALRIVIFVIARFVLRSVFEEFAHMNTVLYIDAFYIDKALFPLWYFELGD